MTPKVFLLCLAAGLVCGAADGLLSPLRKSAGRVFTIITDVILALVTVGLHALVMYFVCDGRLYFVCDGRLFFYAVAAQIAGFAVSRALLGSIAKTVKRKRKKISSPT